MEPTCPNGHRGALERAEARRLPGVLVVLGFTLFSLSLVGAAGGAIGLFCAKFLERESGRTPAQIRQELEKAAVPEPVIVAVLDDHGAPTLPEEANNLDPQQADAVQRAMLARLSHHFPPDAVQAGSLTLIGLSAAGAVVGWLLRSKKTRLQCAECGAPVPA